MELFVLVYNDDDGVRAELATSQADANTNAARWIAPHWAAMFPGTDAPEDWRDAMEALAECSGFIDSVQSAAHQIDAAGLIGVDEAWKICLAPQDSFGVLYDAAELARQFDGDADFEPDKHLPALRFWCNREAESLQAAFSDVSWANAPNIEALDVIAAELAREANSKNPQSYLEIEIFPMRNDAPNSATLWDCADSAAPDYFDVSVIRKNEIMVHEFLEEFDDLTQDEAYRIFKAMQTKYPDADVNDLYELGAR